MYCNCTWIVHGFGVAPRMDAKNTSVVKRLDYMLII